MRFWRYKGYMSGKTTSSFGNKLESEGCEEWRYLSNVRKNVTWNIADVLEPHSQTGWKIVKVRNFLQILSAFLDKYRFLPKYCFSLYVVYFRFFVHLFLNLCTTFTFEHYQWSISNFFEYNRVSGGLRMAENRYFLSKMHLNHMVSSLYIEIPTAVPNLYLVNYKEKQL